MTSTDTPTPVEVTPAQVNVLTTFIQNLLQSGQLRQDFNPATPQFWTLLGSVAAIVVAWVNPSDLISSAVQATITAVGGLVIAIITHYSASKTPVSKIQKMISAVPSQHAGLIAKAFVPVVLNPSPSGGLTGGNYPLGTHQGSVLAPGAVTIVPAPAGGSTGRGGVTVGFTDEGNVTPNVTVNVQSGPYPTPNSESNLPLGTGTGTNSAEGTGGPVIGQQQGGLGTGGSVEAPGAYVAPTPNPPNVDAPGSTTFIAKEQAPVRKARPRKETK